MTQKTFRHYTDGAHIGWGPEVKIGDEVILVERYDINHGDTQWQIRLAPDGVPGNSDSHVRRYHGWRGTTNNISITAHGLRRVIKVRDNDNDKDFDVYQIVTVGADLHPDWE